MPNNYSEKLTLELVDKISAQLLKIKKSYADVFREVERTLHSYRRLSQRTFEQTKRDIHSMTNEIKTSKVVLRSFSKSANDRFIQFQKSAKNSRKEVDQLRKSLTVLNRVDGTYRNHSGLGSRVGTRIPSKQSLRKGGGGGGAEALLATAGLYLTSSGLVGGFKEREPMYRDVAKPGDFTKSMMTLYRNQAQKEIVKLGITMKDYTSASTSLLKAGVGVNVKGLDKVKMIVEMSSEIVKTASALDMDADSYSSNMTQLGAVLKNTKNPKTGKAYGLNDALKESLKSGARINYLDDILMGNVSSRNLNEMVGISGASLVQAGLNPAEMLTLLGVNKQTVTHPGRAAHGIKNLIMEFQKGGKRKGTRNAMAKLGLDAEEVSTAFNKDAYATVIGFFEQLDKKFDDSVEGRKQKNKVMIDLLGDQSIYVAGLVSNYKELRSVYKDLMDKEASGFLDRKMQKEIQRNLDLTVTKARQIGEEFKNLGENLIIENQGIINYGLGATKNTVGAASEAIKGNKAVAGGVLGGFIAGAIDLVILTINRFFGTQFPTILGTIFNAIKNFLPRIGILVQSFLTSGIVMAWIAPIWAGITGFITTLMPWIAGVVSGLWGVLLASILSGIAIIVDIAFFNGSLFTNTLVDWISGAFNSCKKFGEDFASFVWNNFLAKAMNTFSEVGKLFSFLSSKMGSWWNQKVVDGRVNVDINDHTKSDKHVTAKGNSPYTKVSLNTGTNNMKPA